MLKADFMNVTQHSRVLMVQDDVMLSKGDRVTIAEDFFNANANIAFQPGMIGYVIDVKAERFLYEVWMTDCMDHGTPQHPLYPLLIFRWPIRQIRLSFSPMKLLSL